MCNKVNVHNSWNYGNEERKKPKNKIMRQKKQVKTVVNKIRRKHFSLMERGEWENTTIDSFNKKKEHLIECVKEIWKQNGILSHGIATR